MIEIAIPGQRALRLERLVLDYNGTLALDGEPLPGVRESLASLAGRLEVHVLTADTHGGAADRLAGVPCHVEVVPRDGQTEAKRDYVSKLGPESTACVGNGRNDRLMLQEAALGIAVVQEEGAVADTVMAADVVVPSILAAFGLLEHPLRLVATLRG
jgi:soluble P-type ATPase